MEQIRNENLLQIEHLTIGFKQKDAINKVVNDVSFSLQRGEIIGIVGESGSGKSMSALAIMGLLPKDAIQMDGSILYEEKDLLKADPNELRKLKGKQLSMIFQEPMTSLNPVMKIGYQVEEMLQIHEPELSQKDRKDKTLQALTEAGLDHAQVIYDQYPHQLSGGMRQRAMIAMALICNPKLLIADEPTTALDVTIQANILRLIKEMSKKHGTSVILISHDLGVIKNICQRALVMQNGIIVEEGPVEELFNNPQNEYTRKLIEAMPTRNKKRKDTANQRWVAVNKEPILDIKNLNVFYEETDTQSKKTNLWRKSKKKVVDNVSLTVVPGEILGIVGESGCGKSSLAKAIVGLNKDKTGEIKLNTARPQMVFQDPYGSLNPAKKVSWILEEPLKLSGSLNKLERKQKVIQILNEVGLGEEYASRYLSQLSGGQRQRVAIGVALIQNAEFIVLDEPVSALDVTVQAQIMELLKKIQREYNLTYLFISHDLNVIYQMCSRVCVMYQGKIVETEEIDELYGNPKHPYSKQLLEASL